MKTKLNVSVWAGSKTGKKGLAWVVPDDQVQEFFSGPIDYRKLCQDCLKSDIIKKTKLKIKS